ALCLRFGAVLPGWRVNSSLHMSHHRALVSFRLCLCARCVLVILSLHDALPICPGCGWRCCCCPPPASSCCTPRSGSCPASTCSRSEEHTSELQSRFDLVCRLLLEQKKECE